MIFEKILPAIRRRRRKGTTQPNGIGKREKWAVLIEKHLEELRKSGIVEEINEESICIDCGANVGNVTEIFASKGATVHAFEPNPAAFAEMEKRFKTNNKVKIYNKAVSTRRETLRLYMHHHHDKDEIFWSIGASTYKTKDDIDKESYVDVESIDILEFIREIGDPIDVLKIDVEGREYEILIRLIEEELHKRIRHILVETHDKHIPEIVPQGRIVRKLIRDRNIENIDLDWE